MIFAHRAAFLAGVPRLEPAYDDSASPRAGRPLAEELPLPAEPSPHRVTADHTTPARRIGGPAVAARILAAVVEVLACRRPLHHLAAWATQDVLARIARLDEQPTAVRSVRVSEPAAGVAEATAVLTRGTRVVAAAARFEAVEGRWLCTALDLL